MKWLYFLKTIAELITVLLKKRDQEERAKIEESIKENPRAFFQRGVTSDFERGVNPKPSDPAADKLHTDTKE